MHYTMAFRMFTCVVFFTFVVVANSKMNCKPGTGYRGKGGIEELWVGSCPVPVTTQSACESRIRRMMLDPEAIVEEVDSSEYSYGLLDFPTKWTSTLVFTIICVRVRIGLLTRRGEQFIPALDDIFDNILVLVAIFVEPSPCFRNEEHVVHTGTICATPSVRPTAMSVPL